MMKVLLPPELAGVTKLCDPDDARSALRGVRVEAKEGGAYRVDVANGRYAVVVEGKADVGTESSTAADGVKTSRELGVEDHPAATLPGVHPDAARASAILPAKELRAALTAAGKVRAGRPILKTLHVDIGENETRLTSTNLETVNAQLCRNLDGRFPDVDRVFPTEEPAARVTVNAKTLAAVLLAAVSAVDDDDGLTRVELALYPKGKQPILTVSGKVTDRTFRAVFVCLSEGK